MKILRLLWLLVLSGDTINYTLATTATQFSNVGTIYCCDFGANPNYSVVSTNGLSVTQSIAVTVIADGKSKVYGDENPALTAVVTGAVNGYHQLYPSNYCHSIL
jgi:hypothetical protein